MTARLTVLKLGGELIEDAPRTRALAHAIAAAAAEIPLIVVHGGGREIGVALARAGIATHQVDGIRVTDEATLGVVVSVLAGSVNTRFVAAIGACGGRAVGLTGADASVAPAEATPSLVAVDGRTVSLGLVGQPSIAGHADLLTCLIGGGYIPVIASIAADSDGTLYNVNADTMAAAVAIRANAGRLAILGTTPGVLDANRDTVGTLDPATEAAMVSAGTIHAGMIAKVRACRTALAGGVPTATIGDGRDPDRVRSMLCGPADTAGTVTRVVA